jgi:hypothetical protein
MNTKINVSSSSRFTLLKVIILPLVAVALLCSACGTGPKPAQQLPDGAYTTTVTTEDMTNIGMPPDGVCENAGTFTLTVTGKTWSMFQAAAPGCIVKNPSWNGTWKFCGDEVAFTESRSRYKYKWTFNGSELRFTRVNDISPSRIVWMTTTPWILQK